MRFSSEDVARQKFEVRFRGYDREQVREFLTVIAAHLSDYVAENRRLTNENVELARKLGEYRRREVALQDALEMARHAADETRGRAEREAEVLVAEAELTAEHKIASAERLIAASREALAELKEQRRRLASELRATLHTHLRLVDAQKLPDYDDLRPADADTHSEGRSALRTTS